ncbi:YfiR family protein [Methylomonas koyamae]|uniref:YfiR family protein n=1 Tax=Methylomonas koyamae TaxID=702114 RepID=UPI0028735682|nr:YfiR family protein [Methylomonas koyamae]WNB76642.1 YfiR family protein [Methylomonas koyamae]
MRHGIQFPPIGAGLQSDSRRRTLRLLALLLFSLAPNSASAQENPYRVKAAFLRNFAHYVGWPSQALPDSGSPWCVGILGPDPFGEILDDTLRGRSEQGRGFRIVRAERLTELPLCQLVYIGYTEASQRQEALAELRNKPVLTVGDAPEFLAEGGVIGFVVDERVGMNINLDQARAVSLTIQTKMLEVSAGVLFNGTMRRMR